MIFKYQKTITSLRAEQELDIISDGIKKLSLPAGFFEFVIYVISELLANVKEHAKTNKALVSVRADKHRCLIGIVDKGVGLKQPYLSKHIYVKDDFAAIEFAIGGLSTKNFQERGFGLYSIRKLTEGLGGGMIVQSGFAAALIRKNKIHFSNLKNELRGVTVKIEAPVKKIDFYKVVS